MERRLRRVISPMRLVILLLLASILGGCLEDEPAKAKISFANAYNADDEWLVYWYVCGTDLESNYGAATLDMGELLDVDLPANVKVLIQTGGSSEWQNEAVTAGAVGRYLYDADGLHELAALPDRDMGDRETLRDFLQYGRDNFKADHRVFVFWDHGGGSAAGVCMDERTGNALSLNDIQGAFASAHQPSADNPPFELVGFDACLMAAYDVANTLHGLSRYMVASEELEPGNGWYYTGWVKALGENPAMGGAGLGQAICDSYMKGCQKEGTEEAATLSCVDLSKLPALRTAYESFGVEALRHAKENPRSFFASFGREAQQAENYGGNTRDQGYADMVDLGDLAKEAGELLPETSSALRNAIDSAVIYKVQGKYREKGCGLSGFYPYDGDTGKFSSYAAQDAAPLPHKCLYHYLLYGQMPQETEQLLAGKTPNVQLPAEPPVQAPAQGIFQVADLEDMPVDIDQKGNAFVNLSANQLEQLASVHCQLVYFDVNDDIILYLGSDSDVDADWDKGIIKDNFRGVWPMLNGYPVYIEVTAEEDDYNLYSVPIKLNGKECNLQVVYTFADEKYHILGARKSIDNHGMGDRNLIKVKKGDRITTIHYGMTISGPEEDFIPVDVETFTVGEKLTMRDEKMGDGTYGYCFEFVTPKNDSALSKLVQFTIVNGEITTSVDE